ncbi:gamma-butyrobetaine dioxygenase-like [Maniola hyperantus]|uniref:gamma-butyrobetaine dioxygenase-like n=1 Tax=Aphantopus hyperantus TaxID=2795564 RepID=UPI00156935F9|nr:gamma-butyrobetaine dioxygenase-like [Maniola hyperantus]
MFHNILLRRLSVTNRVKPQLDLFRDVKHNKLHRNSVLHKWVKDDFMTIKFQGKPLRFPNVWLRDNCQCEKCFHQSAKSRILDLSKFNVNVQIKTVVQDETSVQVTWDDDHSSKYGLDWLKFRSFTPEDQLKYTNTLYRPVKKLWHGEDFQKICSKHDYDRIVNCDDALYDWLHDLAIYGVVLIQNTPQSDDALDRIIERVGFIKRTHYGVKFVVENVANTSNVAYLSSNLQMHVDLPYYEYCPGVNMLHCLVQTVSEGGENLLADCHYTARYMKEHHPEEYKLLTDTEVEWTDVGVEHGNQFFKLYRSPVICLDRHGEIKRINFSVPQRGSHFPGSIETVKPWYEAHGLFYELNQKFAAKFKTKAGDILVFDNVRLLHGRNAYEDKSGNVRKLLGAYMDWDEIYSRLRCLKLKFCPVEGK